MTQPWSGQEHDRIRALFPGAEAGPYFDVAARGLISTRVKAAVDAYTEHRLGGGADKQKLWELVDSARTRYARLVHAQADEIAIVKNVSEGLNLFANSLPWVTGDNVVVCPGLEHPNNVFLWYNLRDRLGIEVRELVSEDGHFPVEALGRAVDDRTRLVTLPSISFAPGFVTDVAGVTKVAHAKNALVLVDAAQSVGGLDTDVGDLGVDALAVATQKCLLSLYGFGFLYVRREVAESLRPASVGRYGIDLGDAHETALGEHSLRFKAGARRFDLSNHNYLGAAAADASLALIEELGIKNIETHVHRLAARLSEGLGALGLPVAGGNKGPHLSHIVCVGTSGGGRHDTADDPSTNALWEHLVAQGTRLSVRSGTVRFSVAVYNNDADVDRVLAWAAESVRMLSGSVALSE